MQKSNASLANSVGVIPNQPVPYRQGALSVAIQTDFRETSIQTDPWTAPIDETTASLQNQKLRDLLDLSYQSGLLPAHERTMHMIEVVTEDKKFEQSIPPPVDPTAGETPETISLEKKRIQMLIERDIRQWTQKEQELAKQHALRVRLLVDGLAEREEARQELRDELLDRLQVNQQAKLQTQALKLTERAVLELKKSSQQLQGDVNRAEKLAKTNIVSDRLVQKSTLHTNRPALCLPQQKTTREIVDRAVKGANPLNAPVLRPGEAPYRFAGVIRLAGTELKTEEDFKEILKFQKQFQAEQVQQKKVSTKYAVSKENGYLPARMVEGNRLEAPDTRPEWLRTKTKRRVEDAELEGVQEVKQIPQLSAVQKQFENPPDVNDAAKNDAVLYIQNLLRGKSTQNRLENGKNRRLGLVEELRLAHILVQTRSQDQNLQKLGQERFKMLQEALVQNAAFAGSGGHIGQTVDQIEKERTRMQQVMRARGILQIALRERARRENLEQDQRSKEVLTRARKDYTRAQLQLAHREFVDMVVDQLQRNALEEDAKAQASDLALREVQAIVELDYQQSIKGAPTDYKDQLESYLGEFLLPEVDRQIQRAKLAKAEEKWFLAGNLGKEVCENVGKYHGKAIVDDEGKLEVEQKK